MMLRKPPNKALPNGPAAVARGSRRAAHPEPTGAVDCRCTAGPLEG